MSERSAEPQEQAEGSVSVSQSKRRPALRRRGVLFAVLAVLVAGGGTAIIVASQQTSTSTRPSPAPTTRTTATPLSTALPPGAFDPVTFDWATVGAPSTGLVNVSGTGDLSLTKKGQVLDGVKVSQARVVTTADGIRLSNCNIGTFHADAQGLSAEHCTINGGVYGEGSYVLDHNFITSQGDGIDPTGKGQKVIQYNKIWRDGTRVGEKHQDGIQFWQGGNTIIRRNWIGGFGTSAIMVKADHGTISNVTIDSNYLNNPTGYFQLYLCPQSHSLVNITITNNAFGKATSVVSTCRAKLTFVHTEAQRQAAIKAGNAAAANWIVWDNNYVAATHAVLAPPGGWAQ